MIRFLYVILMNLHHSYMIPKMEYMARHPEKYSIFERYNYAKLCVTRMKRAGKIETLGFGMEKLPNEGGYIMFPNHQGKYDALGIFDTHKKPCSVVIDDEKSHTILVKQFIDITESKRLKKDDIKQSIKVIVEMANEAKKGKRFIIFPEGGYDHNQNRLGYFKPGSFKSAVKAKVPIVPVALVDSYKPFEEWSLEPVVTQVHYLDPIFYDDYKDMNTVEIAQIVSDRIKDKIQSVVGIEEAYEFAPSEI